MTDTYDSTSRFLAATGYAAKQAVAETIREILDERPNITASELLALVDEKAAEAKADLDYWDNLKE